MCKEFSDLVKNEVMNCPYIEGAKDLLEYAGSKYMTFLASITPQKELEEIIDYRDMRKYFKNIYGGTCTKDIIINKILEDNDFKKEEVLLVGDQLQDYEAAKETKN